MSREQRLKNWIETLSIEQMKTIILETVDYCIDSEMVSFYDSYKKPIWSNTGDPLDGSELQEDDLN